MKTILLILVAFIGLGTGLEAQNLDLLAGEIDLRVKEITTNILIYDTTSVSIFGESTEGGQAIKYFEGKELKLLQVVYFGEMGKSTLEYYFDEDQLIFVYDEAVDYNRPIYYTEEKARENNDSEAFDIEKSVYRIDNYYFMGRELIYWLDIENEEVDINMGTNSLTGQGLIAHLGKLNDKFNERKNR